ncbi:MAG TPA: hypothetical protein VF662_03315 [Allosphingosinicella sp.]|jgi:hypothetical protein
MNADLVIRRLDEGATLDIELTAGDCGLPIKRRREVVSLLNSVGEWISSWF